MSRSPPQHVALFLVGVGGFVGAILRHSVTVLAPTTAVGTFVVNVVGSFALGLVLSDARFAQQLSSRTRLLLGTGVLSSFTTYSTFALETTAFSTPWALAYVSANYAFALLAVVAATMLARWLS